ncbi:site-specific integrase [Halostagnicola bangensis]
MLGKDAESVQQERQAFYNWMIEKGKSPLKHDPLSKANADNYYRRLDQLHRTAIESFDPEDKTRLTTDQADELLLLLARDEIQKVDGGDYTDASKRKFTNALAKYFEWQYHEGTLEFQWRPRVKFSDGPHTSAAEFTYEEVGRLLNVSKSYGKLPSYYETSPEERDRIHGLVAQRLSKPKTDVTRQDWQRADQSTKIWTLISVGYDAGLIPAEIQEAEVNWYKPEQQILKVPREQAAKEREKYIISLSEESCDGMSRWIRERRHLEKYDGSNKLWLNREGNPYQSGSLCNLLRKLCEEADVPTEDREVRWYSLRHTLGRHMKSDGSLTQTNDQLRHEVFETTASTYGNSAAEERQQTLDKSRRKAKRAAEDPEYNPYAEDTDTTTADEGSTTSGGTDAVLTDLGGGTLHADTYIEDTTEAKVDITRKILSDDDSPETAD